MVVQKLRDLIVSGKIGSGQRLPSERSLADQLGVSRQSVQAAIRDLESLGLVLRQPNCRPIVMPAGAKPKGSAPVKGDQIAVWILPDQQDFGGNMILQGIRAACGEAHYRVLIGCPPSYAPSVVERAEVDFLHSLTENPHIAGAIIWDSGNLACVPVYRSLVERGFPLVFIDREPLCEIQADVVATNNRQAARAGMRHLLELGHRRVAMVLGNERPSSVLERMEGYQTSLRQAEIEPDPTLIYELSLAVDPASEIQVAAQRLIRQIVEHPAAPTAVFAVNDRIALHLLEAAKNLGISIPGRLSLLGFDWLMRLLPSGGDLTCVAQRFDEIGRIAAERVLSRIAASSPETSRLILLDTFLVRKHSAGAPFDSPSSSIHTNELGGIHEPAPSSRLHAH